MQFCYVSVFSALVYTRLLHATAPFCLPLLCCIQGTIHCVHCTIWGTPYQITLQSAADVDIILKDVGADMNAWIGKLRTVLKFKSHQDGSVEKL